MYILVFLLNDHRQEVYEMVKKRKPAIKYFLAGANWDGTDMLKTFITKGVWQSGWDPIDNEFIDILKKISVGDRIAIKKRLGPNEPTQIAIRAIGIVTYIDLENEKYHTIYVNWIRTGMFRKVDSRGAYATIHGPYSRTSTKYGSWVNEVFCL